MTDDTPTPTPDPEAGPDPTVRRPPSARGGRRGRATRPVDPGRPCLNCGDPTEGEYCPTCGQRKVDVQVSVRTMVMDVLEDQFILDRRLPRTLQALLFKPGFLTVEHVNGRIVRYIRPFRLYLVSSLLFFLLLSFLSLRLVRSAEVGTGDRDDRGAVSDSARVAEIDSLLAGVDSGLVVMDSTLAEGSLPPGAQAAVRQSRTRMDRERTRLVAERDSLLAVLDGSLTVPPAPAPGARDAAGADADTVTRPPVTAEDTMGTPWLRSDNFQVRTGIPRVDQTIRQRLVSLSYLPPKEALETVVRDFMSYAPTMMFILLPVFAGVLKLLYIRRRRFYAEHFVFLLHVHSFVYLQAAVMLLLREYVAGWLEVVLVAWLLIYILVAMKKVYGQGWIKTFLKYWTLGWAYFWVLTLAFPVAFVITILLL